MNWWHQIGGVAMMNVTKKTQLVVVGREPGADKRAKALKYGIPYLPYEILELTRYDWKRADDALLKIPGGPAELIILWLELLDGVYAHYLLTGSSRLRDLTSFGASMVEGLLRITGGSPIEGPGGEVCQPEQPDDPAAYVSLILRATYAFAKELNDVALLSNVS